MEEGGRRRVDSREMEESMVEGECLKRRRKEEERRKRESGVDSAGA